MVVPWKTWLRLTIPALMLFALLEMINLLITNTAFIIIGIAISGGVYFLCLCLLQIINIKELKYHYRIIKNKKINGKMKNEFPNRKS